VLNPCGTRTGDPPRADRCAGWGAAGAHNPGGMARNAILLRWLALLHVLVLLELAVSAGSTTQFSVSDDAADAVAGCGALAALGHTAPTLLYQRRAATTTGSASQQQQQQQQFTFGTVHFALSFDAQSFALRNITSCAPGREQGFLWPAADPRATAGAAAEEFSLWQLNYSDCTAPTPGGKQLDALHSPSAGRNHSTQQLSDGRQMLTMRWDGMEAALPGVTMDVVVTVVMGADSAQAALRGHVTVHNAGHRVCIHSMALPNFERCAEYDQLEYRPPRSG
jgi:hypothetical protein